MPRKRWLAPPKGCSSISCRRIVKLFTGEDEEGEERQNQNIFTVVMQGEDAQLLEAVAVDLEELFERVPGVLGTKKLADGMIVTGPRGRAGRPCGVTKARRYRASPAARFAAQR